MFAKTLSKPIEQSSTVSVALRSVSVWALVISAEVLNGAARESLLVPVLGRTTSGRVSFAIALVLIMSIAVLFIDWIRADGIYQTMFVGAVWVTLTFCFEAALGVWGLGLSWEQILADYDITRGGLMLFGMVFMLLAPTIASKLRHAHTGLDV